MHLCSSAACPECAHISEMVERADLLDHSATSAGVARTDEAHLCNVSSWLPEECDWNLH